MINVFSGNKSLFFIDSRSQFKEHSQAILVEINSKKELDKKYLELMQNKNVQEIYFFHPDLDFLTESFFANFLIIEAAGGLVKNKKEEWLFIFRNNKWDLPKGKIEKGESIKTAATREVEEECGVGKLTILKELPSTYHTYPLNKQMVLKRTYWFTMSCDDDSKLAPQLEEGITHVQWMTLRQFHLVKENTYPSVKDVLKEIE